MTGDHASFLAQVHPYDVLPEKTRHEILARCDWVEVAKGHSIYNVGDELQGLYVIVSGKVSVKDANDVPISLLGDEDSFGERGLMRDGLAATSTRAEEDTGLIRIPPALFHELLEEHEPYRRFFGRAKRASQARISQSFDLSLVRVEALMRINPATCAPEQSIGHAARLMRDRHISCLCIVESNALVGILTLRDIVTRSVAAGLPDTEPVGAIMTRDPHVLPPTAIGSDVLHTMMEYRLGHLPIVEGGGLVGIITQTDLTRYQASNAASFVAEAARAATVPDLAEIAARIPFLLVQLVAAGNRHDVVTRLTTDVTDVVTRRLLRMAEDDLGPPPARYLWLACGSQGRQEQTAVTDQDNCLILADGVGAADMAYFERLARFVSDGLNACGYVYCPGDMMATNPRWRQPLSVWRDYFQGWIAQPNKEAQMLASVMFDLRPIGGDASLFDNLQVETLRAAAANSIFTAHMASNAISRSTPLGLLRGIATIRDGEHRNTIDTKLNGLVPVIDLARMYALQGQLTEVNTRARLNAAVAADIVSDSGGKDLVDAYDLIAQTRLEHQANLIKQGRKPDNFLPPATLSGLDRSHLRDAFVVIKTMQSALMQGRGILG